MCASFPIIVRRYESYGSTHAWFDAVYLLEVPPAPLQTVLVSPSYRGRATATAPSSVEVHAWLGDEACPVLTATLTKGGAHPDPSVLASTTIMWPVRDLGGIALDLQMDPRKLEAGEYDVHVRCMANTDDMHDALSNSDAPARPLASSSHVLTREKDGTPAPTVHIDHRNRYSFYVTCIPNRYS